VENPFMGVHEVGFVVIVAKSHYGQLMPCKDPSYVISRKFM
jgi:hypothetical protein